MKRLLFILLAIVPAIGWAQHTCADMKFENPFRIEPVGHSAKLEINPEAINFIPSIRLVDANIILGRKSTIIPLLVVDGVVRDNYADIHPEDIEDVSILQNTMPESISGFTKTIVYVTTKGNKKTITAYQATVLDAGFSSFVATQRGIDYYSYKFLKTKNTFLVNEWNSRCNQPLTYNPQIYEARIDYDPKTPYGKGVEYTLYLFFKFMEGKNGVSFNIIS